MIEFKEKTPRLHAFKKLQASRVCLWLQEKENFDIYIDMVFTTCVRDVIRDSLKVWPD